MTDTFKPHSPEKYGAETSPRLQQMQLILDEYRNTAFHPKGGSTSLLVLIHDNLDAIEADPDIMQLLITNRFMEPGKTYFDIDYTETNVCNAITHHRAIARGKTCGDQPYVIGSALSIYDGYAVESVFIVPKMKVIDKPEDTERLQFSHEVMVADALDGDRENYDSLGLVDPVLQKVLRVAQGAFPGNTILDIDPQDDEL
jgi:hypothetical protein